MQYVVLAGSGAVAVELPSCAMCLYCGARRYALKQVRLLLYRPLSMLGG